MGSGLRLNAPSLENLFQKLVQLEKEEKEHYWCIENKDRSMKQEEDEEHSISALPVIPRLDRIDRLLQFLEEKHSSRRKQNSSGPAGRQSSPEDQELRTLSSAMEEVHHKGTLMERLAMLENRVLQLGMEMEEGNTSGSGSGSGSSSSSIQDPAQTITKQEEVCADHACEAKPAADSHNWKTKGHITRRRKWLPSWFQMGC